MILSDTHVHIYSCYPLDRFFDAALQNLSAVATKTNNTEHTTYALLLAETRADTWFQNARDQKAESTEWQIISHRDDPATVIAEKRNAAIYIVAGRQVITRERLEVLMLCSNRMVNDGLSLRETVYTISKAGGVPVIPWGFGKWSGKRSETLDAFLADDVQIPFFLGDNGGRPGILSEPRQFQCMKKRGLPVLPGSDTLPLPHDLHRVGCSGVQLPGDFSDAENPSERIKQMLMKKPAVIKPFDRRLPFAAFMKNQLLLRLKRH